MAKATLAPGKPLACLYYIDEISSFPGGCSRLPARLCPSLKETQ